MERHRQGFKKHCRDLLTYKEEDFGLCKVPRDHVADQSLEQWCGHAK